MSCQINPLYTVLSPRPLYLFIFLFSSYCSLSVFTVCGYQLSSFVGQLDTTSCTSSSREVRCPSSSRFTVFVRPPLALPRSSSASCSHGKPHPLTSEPRPFIAFIFSLCFIHHFERLGNKISLFDTYWFVVVTFSTVGYGDISPAHWTGKVIITIFIIAALMYLPPKVSIFVCLSVCLSLFLCLSPLSLSLSLSLYHCSCLALSHNFYYCSRTCTSTVKSWI